MNQGNLIDIYARGLFLALAEVHAKDFDIVLENFVKELSIRSHSHLYSEIEPRLVELLKEQTGTGFSDDQGLIERLNKFTRTHNLDKSVQAHDGIIFSHEEPNN